MIVVSMLNFYILLYKNMCYFIEFVVNLVFH